MTAEMLLLKTSTPDFLGGLSDKSTATSGPISADTASKRPRVTKLHLSGISYNWKKTQMFFFKCNHHITPSHFYWTDIKKNVAKFSAKHVKCAMIVPELQNTWSPTQLTLTTLYPANTCTKNYFGPTSMELPEKMRSKNVLYVNVFQLIIHFPTFHIYFLIFRLTRGSSIGLLDLSGFENFKQNGFDQLLINISNEKLQQYFMDYIFPREKKDYEAEGIEWRDIVYHSNDDVLELVFKVSHVVLWHNYVTTSTEFASFANVENVCNRKKWCVCFYCFRGTAFFHCWMRSPIFHSPTTLPWSKNSTNIVRTAPGMPPQWAIEWPFLFAITPNK